MKRYINVLLVCLFLVSGCAFANYGRYNGDQFKSIPAFYKVNSSLYRGGKPDMEGIIRLKNMNIKTIISFQQDSDEVNNERVMANGFGMEFYNIPISAYESPTDRQVLQFLGIVTNEKNFPVFAHCAGGRDVTGAMIAMYRVVVDGWPVKEAYQEAKDLGFLPYKRDAELKAFIYRSKDKDIYFIKAGRMPIAR